MTSQPIRAKRSVTLRRTGHAGGHLRNALYEALDFNSSDTWINHVDISFCGAGQQQWWNSMPHMERAQWLIGQLWNCRDILPSLVRQQIEDEYDTEVFTVAQAVRLLKGDLVAGAE